MNAARTAGPCDLCSTVGPRWLVVDRPDDLMPSHLLACAACAGIDTPPAPAVDPRAAAVLVSAAATIDTGGSICAEQTIRRCAAAIAPGDRVTVAAHATLAVLARLDVDDLARWCAYPTRTRGDVVAVLRATAAELPAPAPLPAVVPAVPGEPVGEEIPTREWVGRVERATFELAGQLDAYGARLDATLNRFAELLAGRVTDIDRRIDHVDARIAQADAKVIGIGQAFAADLATIAQRLDALKTTLGHRVVDQAEQILRGE